MTSAEHRSDVADIANSLRLKSLDSSSHLERVSERWRGLEERIDIKLKQLAAFDRKSEERLIDQAAKANTANRRVYWLRRAADLAINEASKHAACKKGCSHCCRISVVLSQAEAQVIAKETGHPLNTKAGRFSADGTTDIDVAKAMVSAEQFGKPCVFLRNEQCSIYEHRPLVCRWQINLDDDDLLCHLIPGEPPKVPYLDMAAHEYSAVMIMGPHQRYDDIRSWFAQVV